MAKFRFATDGSRTIVELDGKGFGLGVQSVTFQHTGGDYSRLGLEIDVNSFEFMQEGEYDQRERALMGESNQNGGAIPHIVTAV